MYKITIEERVLHFKQPAGTSRGVYTERRIWLVRVFDGSAVGVGECAPLPQLSCDDLPNYGEVLRRFCDDVERTGEIPYEALRDYPSMLFGLETAVMALRCEDGTSYEVRGTRCENTLEDTNHDDRATGHGVQGNLAPRTSHLAARKDVHRDMQPILFDTPFSRGEAGIPINGLVWMGTFEEMSRRIEQKLEQGFRCIKLKIGAIDFDAEVTLLKRIRERFGPREVELRVDANGAFPYDEALYKLELLSQYALHSIEQPIRAGQWANMAELCRDAPLPIALDEELIGINDPDQKRQMLNIIRPAYIVLKPSLHGGMAGTREWVNIARDMGIGSWITSALESNVGLNAVAQLCSSIYGSANPSPLGYAACSPKGSQEGGEMMPQGLGTGQLFTDNIPMPLEIRGDQLWMSKRS